MHFLCIGAPAIYMQAINGRIARPTSAGVMHMKKPAVLAVLNLLLFAVPAIHANVTRGSIGFATPLLAQADASPTGNINTSDAFSLESLATTDNASGVFMGLPIQSFGTVSFDTTIGNSLHIADGEFGSFASHSITVINNTPGFLNLLLQGMWTPGSFEGGSVPSPADFRISFTQSPVATGEISFSGTMSTAAVLPEPSTGLLFLTGAGLLLIGVSMKHVCFSATRGA